MAWRRIVWFVAVLASPVHAQPSAATEIAPLAVDYAAPPECPDEISLRAGVIARLGHDPFADAATRRASVRIEGGAAGYVGVIVLHEAARAESRRAIAPTRRCADAVAALELALAVIVDPTSGGSQPEPPPRFDPQPRTFELPGWREQPPAQPRARPHEIAFAVGSIAGDHPESATSIAIRAGYQTSARWRVGVIARVAIAQGELDATRRHRTSITELAAEGCARRWFASACALVGIGTKAVNITRTGPMFAFDTVADYRDPYALVGASLALEVPLGSAFLRPAIELSMALPRVAIASEGVERAELWPVRVGFDLALGYRW